MELRDRKTNDGRAPGDGPLIALRKVGKSYATPAGLYPALRDIDLEIGAGEFVAPVGKSGSGKTTLLNLIGGIDCPSQGEVIVAGAAVHQASANSLARWRGKTVGMVFQFFQLLPTLTVAEHVMLPMDFCNLRPPGERRARALELLDLVRREMGVFRDRRFAAGGVAHRGYRRFGDRRVELGAGYTRRMASQRGHRRLDGQAHVQSRSGFLLRAERATDMAARLDLPADCR